MIRNEAEHIFIQALSEVPSVKRNGITHSEEYFETMLDDANLSNNERIALLSDINPKVNERIRKLTAEHCKIAHKIAFYDEHNDTFVKKAVAEKQRRSFIGQIMSIATIFYLMFLGGMSIAMIIRNPTRACLVSSLLLGLLGSLALARLLTNKHSVYIWREEEFFWEVEADQQELDRLKAEILSLERLRKFIDEDMRSCLDY